MAGRDRWGSWAGRWVGGAGRCSTRLGLEQAIFQTHNVNPARNSRKVEAWDWSHGSLLGALWLQFHGGRGAFCIEPLFRLPGNAHLMETSRGGFGRAAGEYRWRSSWRHGGRWRCCPGRSRRLPDGEGPKRPASGAFSVLFRRRLSGCVVCCQAAIL